MAVLPNTPSLRLLRSLSLSFPRRDWPGDNASEGRRMRIAAATPVSQRGTGRANPVLTALQSRLPRPVPACHTQSPLKPARPHRTSGQSPHTELCFDDLGDHHQLFDSLSDRKLEDHSRKDRKLEGRRRSRDYTGKVRGRVAREDFFAPEAPSSNPHGHSMLRLSQQPRSRMAVVARLA
jgi:hypothetical protein